MTMESENRTRELHPINPMDHPGRYIFVVGSPRSGTTLLRTIFSSHPEVAVSPELKFFFRVVPSEQRYQPLDETGHQKKLTDHIFDKIEKFGQVAPYAEWHDDPRSTEEILTTKKREFRSLLSQEKISRADVFTQLVNCFSDKEARSHLIKTPHNLYMIPTILDTFPDAKFLHLVRDGRDVVASLLKGKRQSLDRLWKGAALWGTFMRLGRHWADRLPDDQFQTVHFETLLDQSENTLQRICDFFGVDNTPSLLSAMRPVNSSFETPPADGEETADVTLNPNAVGRHREHLTDRETRIVEAMVGHHLRDGGYELHTVRNGWDPGSLPWRLLYRYFVTKEGIKNYFRNRGRFHWLLPFVDT